MDTQEIRYRVTKKVFRQASIYALLQRNRGTFRVGIVVILVVALYTAMAVQGVFRLDYLQSDASLLGTEYVLRFDGSKISIDIPEKKLHNAMPFAKLVSAIEISSAFMLYVSAEQLYLVPTDAMTAEQRSALRGLLDSRLGERFYSSVLAREKKRK